MWVPPAIITEINTGLTKMASDYGMEYLDLHTLFLMPDGTPDAAVLKKTGFHLEEEGLSKVVRRG